MGGWVGGWVGGLGVVVCKHILRLDVNWAVGHFGAIGRSTLSHHTGASAIPAMKKDANTALAPPPPPPPHHCVSTSGLGVSVGVQPAILLKRWCLLSS